MDIKVNMIALNIGCKSDVTQLMRKKSYSIHATKYISWYGWNSMPERVFSTPIIDKANYKTT